jgi:hypothetical protein
MKEIRARFTIFAIAVFVVCAAGGPNWPNGRKPIRQIFGYAVAPRSFVPPTKHQGAKSSPRPGIQPRPVRPIVIPIVHDTAASRVRKNFNEALKTDPVEACRVVVQEGKVLDSAERAKLARQAAEKTVIEAGRTQNFSGMQQQIRELRESSGSGLASDVASILRRTEATLKRRAVARDLEKIHRLPEQQRWSKVLVLTPQVDHGDIPADVMPVLHDLDSHARKFEPLAGIGEALKAIDAGDWDTASGVLGRVKVEHLSQGLQPSVRELRDYATRNLKKRVSSFHSADDLKPSLPKGAGLNGNGSLPPNPSVSMPPKDIEPGVTTSFDESIFADLGRYEEKLREDVRGHYEQEYERAKKYALVLLLYSHQLMESQEDDDSHVAAYLGIIGGAMAVGLVIVVVVRKRRRPDPNVVDHEVFSSHVEKNEPPIHQQGGWSPPHAAVYGGGQQHDNIDAACVDILLSQSLGGNGRGGVWLQRAGDPTWRPEEKVWLGRIPQLGQDGKGGVWLA